MLGGPDVPFFVLSVFVKKHQVTIYFPSQIENRQEIQGIKFLDLEMQFEAA